MRNSRKTLATILTAFLLLVMTALPGATAQADPKTDKLSAEQRRTLERYAADTWRSFVALTFPSGLPADNINAVTGQRSGYTSPTNIAAYI